MEKSPLLRFHLAVLPLLVFAFGCSIIDPSPPTVPNGAVPLLFVPANYEAWFTKTVKCSGVDGRMEPIEWFVVPNVSQFATSNGEKVGIWERRGNHVRIVIAGTTCNTRWSSVMKCYTTFSTLRGIPLNTFPHAAISPGLRGMEATGKRPECQSGTEGEVEGFVGFPMLHASNIATVFRLKGG